MHRSGTSCLTGTLGEAGVFLGEVSTKNRFNPKGNRENQRILSLHQELLQANGGNWDDPPERVRWSDEHRAMRDAIIASYAGKKIWGFKDPRALFTLDGWREALPQIELAGIVRDPVSVARS